MGEFLRNVARAAVPLALTMCGGSVVAPNGDEPDAGDDTCPTCTSKDAGAAHDATVRDATVSDGATSDASGADAADEDAAETIPDAGPEPDDAGPPLSPSDVPGLVLWLEGDLGVVADPRRTGSIAKWQDQSGNGNDAIYGGDPISGGYLTVDSAAQNGHDALSCGATLGIADDPSLTFGTGDFLVIEVVKADLIHGGTYWDKTSGAPGESLVANVSGTPQFEAFVGEKHAIVAAPPGNGIFVILTMRGQATSLRVNGVQANGGTNTVDLTEPNVPVTICGGRPEQETAEVIAVKGSVSIEDTRRIEKYLRIKYAL